MSAAFGGGHRVLVRFHIRNMATPHRLGLTSFVFYTTFFGELIWQTPRPKGLATSENDEETRRREESRPSPALLRASTATGSTGHNFWFDAA
jgi:hypothetical protein